MAEGVDRVRFPVVVPVLLASFLLVGCEREVPQIEYEIAATLPHDPEAYTQGLLFHDGHLYESTGQYGASSLRRVDAETGGVVENLPLDSAYFGEGLALVGSELIQLTWKSGIAFVRDVETFELKRKHEYEGEGWGLCFDGESLFMSNGTSTLVRRDPRSFEVIEEIPVTRNGFRVSQLNELECVGDEVYANVYLTDRIVRIDKRSGEVTGELDGFQLSLAAGAPNQRDAVLNGIAYIPETDVFLVTGKLWPRVFALRLIVD